MSLEKRISFLVVSNHDNKHNNILIDCREAGMAEVPVQVVSERDAEGNSEARNSADIGYVAVSVSAAASEVLASIQVSLIAPVCLTLLFPCTV